MISIFYSLWAAISPSDYKVNLDRVFLQLSLQNPIRQGQTRYQFLVMQFDREEEITAELNIDESVFLAYVAGVRPYFL